MTGQSTYCTQITRGRPCYRKTKHSSRKCDEHRPASPKPSTPIEDLGVCPHEDCPYPVRGDAADCGNHEEWMT